MSREINNTFDTIANLLKSILLSNRSNTLDSIKNLKVTIISTNPLKIIDTQGIELEGLDDRIETVLQDFSFLSEGEQVILEDCRIDNGADSVGKVGPQGQLQNQNRWTIVSKSLFYGEDCTRRAIDTQTEFDITSIISLLPEKVRFDCLKTKQSTAKLHPKSSFCVTDFVSGQDLQKIVKQSEKELEVPESPKIKLGGQEFIILRRLQRVLTKHKLFEKFENLYGKLEQNGKRVVRRMAFPDGFSEQGDIMPIEKKGYSRQVIVDLLQSYRKQSL